MNRKTLKIQPDVKERLDDLKREGETTDGLLNRAFDALESDENSRNRAPGAPRCTNCHAIADVWTVEDGHLVCGACAEDIEDEVSEMLDSEVEADLDQMTEPKNVDMKLVTFDDDSKIGAQTVTEKGDVTDLELETGEVVGVSTDRVSRIENVDEITYEEDGLHGTLRLVNGETFSLPFEGGFAQELVSN